MDDAINTVDYKIGRHEPVDCSGKPKGATDSSGEPVPKAKPAAKTGKAPAKTAKGKPSAAPAPVTTSSSSSEEAPASSEDEVEETESSKARHSQGGIDATKSILDE